MIPPDPLELSTPFDTQAGLKRVTICARHFEAIVRLLQFPAEETTRVVYLTEALELLEQDWRTWARKKPSR